VSNEHLTRKKLPFAAERGSGEFQREVIVRLIREFDKRRTKHIPAENLQTFYHGSGWNFQRQESAGYNPHSGNFKLQSVDFRIERDRILANDLNLISHFLYDTADRQEEQFEHTILGEMKAVAEETGNTISMPKHGSLADALLELIKTTEPIVGPDGKARKPTLFLPPEMIEKLQHDVAERGSEFHEKVEALWKEKEKQALEEEAQRLAQYNRSE
jgi:hypothetical protein